MDENIVSRGIDLMGSNGSSRDNNCISFNWTKDHLDQHSEQKSSSLCSY